VSGRARPAAAHTSTSDTLFGGEGHDRPYGDGGKDVIYGGDGNDWCDGGFGGAPGDQDEGLNGEATVAIP